MIKSGDDENETVEWVLPASIPFAGLKARDLEECVYWLFDALGAKDLEWRTGGTGGGAPDGGRDLEAHFYTPSIDNELEPQVWWVECKGRSGTVEKSEIQEALNNSLAKSDLDYIVIATNTQFSNPTRDWVKEWQSKHKRPKVKLWDSEQLERMLSKHPSVVLRLFSDALSLQGRVKAMESRFWNRLEYSPPGLLNEIWLARGEIEFSEMSMVGAIASEFSNGDITKRQWGAILDKPFLAQVLQIVLLNTPYLVIRSLESGTDQSPIMRADAYLIMCLLREYPAEIVSELIIDSLFRGDADKIPEDVKEYLLLPIVNQLLSELQEVCSDDCSRMIATRKTTLRQEEDKIESYWSRFLESDNEEKEANQRWILIERQDQPCKVGFIVNRDNGCPLFSVDPTPDNLSDVLGIVKRVVETRISMSKTST
ncbi:MAG: restriction endonuclease [Cyanobacteria bacterium J06638_22]